MPAFVLPEEVLWEANPGPQTCFLATSAREVLFGGALGGGKTDGLLMAAFNQADNPAHRAIIFRRTFPRLKDVIGRSWELFPDLGATYNKQEKQWTFPSGAIVEFGYLDSPEDVSVYRGRAFSFLGFDELGEWPGDGEDAGGTPVSQSYLYMLTRLRATGESGLALEVRCTCNPGQVGHHWIKARWGIPDDGGGNQTRDPATGYRRLFIPSRITDNPFLAGTDYERSLNALPEADRKTLRDGRWDVYQGAVFSEWNPRLHVCDPFPIPESWEQWRGADDGYAAPAVVLWFARDPVHDVIYVTRELHQPGMTPEVMAKRTLAMDAGRPMWGIIDAAAFADLGMGGGGRANVMNALGCRWKPSEKGTGSRVTGKASVHQRLALRLDGTPGLRVFRNCVNLIRTLPALPYSKTHPEDVETASDDHDYDALRTGLLARKPAPIGLARVSGY